MPTESEVRDQVIELLLSLRAVREYLDRPVPGDVIDDILRVARWTGSARNRQPWEFIVVEDRDTLRQLAAADGYAKHAAGAPLAIVIVLNGEMVSQECFDEGRVSERVMLAALAHGVGAGIGWFTPDGEATVKALLGVPEHRRAHSVIALGYPDEEARRARPKPPQARKPLSEIVHHERYGGLIGRASAKPRGTERSLRQTRFGYPKLVRGCSLVGWALIGAISAFPVMRGLRARHCQERAIFPGLT